MGFLQGIKLTHNRPIRLVTNDFGYIVFAILFGISCSYFSTPKTPNDMSRFGQVLYYDMSKLFSGSQNPNSFALAQASFIVFGFFKAVHALTQVKWQLLTVQLLQSLFFVLTPLVNDDVSTGFHQFLFISLAVLIAVSIFLQNLFQKYTRRTKKVLFHIISASYCIFITMIIVYFAHYDSVQAVIECKDNTCFDAPALNFGYHEYIVFIWLLIYDWISSSVFFEKIMIKFKLIE